MFYVKQKYVLVVMSHFLLRENRNNYLSSVQYKVAPFFLLSSNKRRILLIGCVAFIRERLLFYGWV